jgi:hypothetical protein
VPEGAAVRGVGEEEEVEDVAEVGDGVSDRRYLNFFPCDRRGDDVVQAGLSTCWVWSVCQRELHIDFSIRIHERSPDGLFLFADLNFFFFCIFLLSVGVLSSSGLVHIDVF